MNRLDELAGWAAANEDVLREFVGLLDELVADRVPAAVELAERIRVEKAAAWVEGFEHGAPGGTGPNPYEAEAGGQDGS